MAAILEDGVLRLSGYVGDYYYSDGFTASDVVMALAGVEDDAELPVHLNSGGGIATEGAAIHALLSARSGVTNIIVEGIAASAASLIAMAGHTVTMSAGAVMMIHDPSGATFGNSADHSKTIEALEALATAYARVYAQKSGKTTEECRQIMRDERWFTPEQAVEEGFADATTETNGEHVAAFDYRLYAHAPKRLTAMAASKNWRREDADNSAAPAVASNRQTMEKPMPGKSNGGDDTADVDKLIMDAVAADRARRSAVMALPETEGRTKLAEHLVNTTTMDVDAIKAILSASPQAAEGQDHGGANGQPDPAAYEANRAAGAGVAGKSQQQPTAHATSLVANMRKLIGKDAA